MEHNTIFSFMRSFSNYVSVADDADSDTEENTSSVAFNLNSGETVWFYPFNGQLWVAYLPERDSLAWVRAITPLSLSANALRFVEFSTYTLTLGYMFGPAKHSNHVVVTTPADEIKKERNQRKQQRQEAKRLLEEKKQREQEAKQKELEQKRLDEQRRLEQEAAKKQREQEAKQKELEQRRLDEQKQRIAAARQALVEKAVNQAAAYRTHFQQFWQSPAVQAQSANPPKAIQHLGSQPKDNTARKLQVSAAPPDQPIGDVQDNQEGQEVEYLGREQQSDKISSDPLAPATPSPQSQEAIVATAAQTPASACQ
jgi:flagellar biosynthesis GTPase FlhF